MPIIVSALIPVWEFNATLFSFVMINIFIETYILHSTRLFIMLIRKANLTLYKDRGRKKCCYVNLTHTWMCIITRARGQKCRLPIGQEQETLASDWLRWASVTKYSVRDFMGQSSCQNILRAKLQTNLWEFIFILKVESCYSMCGIFLMSVSDR